MKSNFELLTGRESRDLLKHEGHLVHKEALSAFNKLKKVALSEANIDLDIISSFRSYDRQKIIWNKKVSGERKVFNSNEVEIDLTTLSSPSEVIDAITRFSAIPGASRHHWGTDIDVFDNTACKKSEVQLQPSEYSECGIFSTLDKWLTEKIKAGESFGFYRPYETDLGGIHPEAWHLSFAPISHELQETYTLDIFTKNLELSDFQLAQDIRRTASKYYQKLLFNVNSPPQM